jgi:tRNA-dihydrouridine synthase A
LRDADERIFGDKTPSPYASRKAVLEAYLPYVEKQTAEGCPATILVKHLYGLFTGLPGARKYRQLLSNGAPRAAEYGGAVALIQKAMDLVQED